MRRASPITATCAVPWAWTRSARGPCPTPSPSPPTTAPPHTFTGTKILHPARLVESMTVLPGAIYDGAGERVGEALLRFDVQHDLRRFLQSFRLA